MCGRSIGSVVLSARCKGERYSDLVGSSRSSPHRLSSVVGPTDSSGFPWYFLVFFSRRVSSLLIPRTGSGCWSTSKPVVSRGCSGELCDPGARSCGDVRSSCPPDATFLPLPASRLWPQGIPCPRRFRRWSGQPTRRRPVASGPGPPRCAPVDRRPVGRNQGAIPTPVAVLLPAEPRRGETTTAQPPAHHAP